MKGARGSATPRSRRPATRGVRLPRRDRHRAGEKGDVRNLTNSVGAHDRFPRGRPTAARSPGSPTPSGEYQLYIGSQDGKGDPRAIKVPGEGFYSAPVWSPDSQKIAYFDNSQSVYWLDVKSGVAKKIASQPIYGPAVIISYAWSPDSKWLAYAMDNQSMITTVYVYSTEQGKSFQVSDGMSDVSDPLFDKCGKYLYFFASTDAGPVKDWFAQSNADMRSTSGIYLAVLQNDLVVAARAGERRREAGGRRGSRTPRSRRPTRAGRQARRPRPEEKRRRRKTRRSASTSRASSIASSICRSRRRR